MNRSVEEKPAFSDFSGVIWARPQKGSERK